MKNSQDFIHRDTFYNDYEVDDIVKQAKDVIPIRHHSRVSLSCTMRQQLFFLPCYAFIFQVLLFLFQLFLLNSSDSVYTTILFMSVLQLMFTFIMANRSFAYEMQELEQVTYCSKQQLFLIRYILVGLLLYAGLTVLAMLSFLSGDFLYLKVSLLICSMYHLCSIVFLYILSKTTQSHNKFLTKAFIVMSIPLLLPIISMLTRMVLHFSYLPLILLSLITMTLFYIYCNKIIRKEHTACK